MNLELTNDKINKLDFALEFCAFLKKYYMDVYTSIYGFGKDADYTFVKQFYNLLEDRDKFLSKFENILNLNIDFLESQEDEFFPEESDSLDDFFGFQKEIDDNKIILSKIKMFH